jgi:hypothetical protein
LPFFPSKAQGTTWSVPKPAKRKRSLGKPRQPRVIRLLHAPGEDGVGLFSITNARGTFYYVFKEIPCEIGGRGFAVHRLGLANLYHVRVDGPRDSSCECLGFLRHGHCKHVQGLTALLAAYSKGEANPSEPPA